MTILGIETSCDETSAAVIRTHKINHIELLSNIVSSSLKLHAKTGGIIPEIAARQQIKQILPVIQKAFDSAYVKGNDIDAIAVTYGPGLIGSLLVGVETAKTLAYVLNKLLIPVNHLVGHIYANFIGEISNIQFPALALLVSGGHTDLIMMKNHGTIKRLGGTRDDAAGEAFDKIGRLLNLSYPAGPIIEKLAKKGNPKAFHFPRPMIGSNDFDFSFSGLKTAVCREVQKIGKKELNADICAGFQQAIIDVLVKKTIFAAQKYKVKSILLGGGVTANQKLRDELNSKLKTQNSKLKLFAPPKSLCTDNAAMIAAAAVFNYYPNSLNKITADPELYFD